MKSLDNLSAASPTSLDRNLSRFNGFKTVAALLINLPDIFHPATYIFSMSSFMTPFLTKPSCLAIAKETSTSRPLT
jgi:hypothetical protein